MGTNASATLDTLVMDSNVLMLMNVLLTSLIVVQMPFVIMKLAGILVNVNPDFSNLDLCELWETVSI